MPAASPVDAGREVGRVRAAAGAPARLVAGPVRPGAAEGLLGVGPESPPAHNQTGVPQQEFGSRDGTQPCIRPNTKRLCVRARVCVRVCACVLHNTRQGLHACWCSRATRGGG